MTCFMSELAGFSLDFEEICSVKFPGGCFKGQRSSPSASGLSPFVW